MAQGGLVVNRKQSIYTRAGWIAFVIALSLLPIETSTYEASATELVLQGSATFNTAVVERYANAVEAETGIKIVSIPNKSNFGLLALFDGKAELAMLSTGLQKEITLLRASNPSHPYESLQAFEIARTRAAFVVHRDNPVRHLPLDVIRGILVGEIRNWKELGGQDLPIRVVAVRPGGGVLATVESRLLGSDHISAPDTVRLMVGTQIVTVVAQETGAIGITQLAIVKDSSAVELTTDEPIEQSLSLVSLGAPSADSMTVIEALRGMAGQSK
jgi:phosphate transport system substrate-binding protein